MTTFRKCSNWNPPGVCYRVSAGAALADPRVHSGAPAISATAVQPCLARPHPCRPPVSVCGLGVPGSDCLRWPSAEQVRLGRGQNVDGEGLRKKPCLFFTVPQRGIRKGGSDRQTT
jgi:hypothetical protein